MPLCAARILVGKSWDQPTDEGILTSCLKRQFPRTRQVDHKAFTAQESALPSPDLPDVESDPLGERDQVAGVDGELLPGAEFDFFDGSVGGNNQGPGT